MPLYEYRCEACGHECEVLQGIHEAELTLCPNCAQPKLHRVVSRVSFRLKGGGWYETDFKKDGRRNVADDGAVKPASGGDAPAADGGGKTPSEEKAAKPAPSTAKPVESSAKPPSGSSPSGTGSGS